MIGYDFLSRENLPGIKDGTNVENLDEKQSKGTHWVSLFVDRHTFVYFYFFLELNIFCNKY